MSDFTKYQITRLNNENYFNWRFRMEMLLKREGAWIAISEERPIDNFANWEKANETAHSVICLMIDDDQLKHVRESKSALEAWLALKGHHERDSPGTKVRLLRHLMSQRANEDTDMELHVSRMNELSQKLLSLAKDLKPEFLMSATLLASLPSSYDALITALEARDEKDLTPALIRAKVIEEFRRRKERENGVNGDNGVLQVSANSGKTNFVCYFCKKRGHFKNQCQRYAEWRSKKRQGGQANVINQENRDEQLFLVGSASSRWVIDSGATCHISSQKDHFHDFDKSHAERVSVANGQQILSSGRGSVEIEFIDKSGRVSNYTINNVLYVPEIRGNLLSVGQLAKIGLYVKFGEEDCEIWSSVPRRCIAVGSYSAGLYNLQVPNQVNSVDGGIQYCPHQWHRILGHRDLRAVRNLIDSDMVDGIKAASCDSNCKDDCVICITCKLTRAAFPKKSDYRAKKPLELIHSDLCGPMPTKTPSGKRYVLTLIDDYSRYTLIYLLKSKSEAFQRFKEYRAMVENLLGAKIKAIRTDRGKEYVNKDFEDYLNRNGIKGYRTAPYSPQQNGVAERKNRTLVEMTRCMLRDANLGNEFWGEAIYTANNLQNILAWKNVERTPFELWRGRKPCFENLHRFGAKCFVKIQDLHRRKLDPKAEEGVFLGFATGSKAYRILSKSGKVIISRDVKFVDSFSETTNCGEGQEIPNSIIGVHSHDGVEDINVSVEFPLSNDVIEEENSEEENTSDVLNDAGKGSKADGLQEVNGGNTVGSDALEEESLEENFADATSDIDGNQDFSEEEEPTSVDITDEPLQRRPVRTNRGNPPKRLIQEIKLVKEEPSSFREAILSKDKDIWKAAMEEEYRALTLNGTWQLVDLPAGRNVIGCKWLFKTKVDSSGEIRRHKARLVAQGFAQKFGVDYDHVFAPVARSATFRTLLSFAGSHKMDVVHFDVKTAFLNAELQEEIYMRQPPGFVKADAANKVCLLKKSLYGLKQAARMWSFKLYEVLIKEGFTQSNVDKCLYIRQGSQGRLFVIVYVDDILAASDSKADIDRFEKFFKSHFLVENLGPISNYLGIRVKKINNYYSLDQERYINSVAERFGLHLSKPASTPLSTSYLNQPENDLLLDNAKYQEAIGCLLFIAVNTRPDTSAAAMIIMRITSKASKCYFEDNQSVLKIIVNESFSSRTKHIDTKRYFVKDHLDKKILSVNYCPTDKMLADLFTKPLPENKLVIFRKKCNLM